MASVRSLTSFKLTLPPLSCTCEPSKFSKYVDSCVAMMRLESLLYSRTVRETTAFADTSQPFVNALLMAMRTERVCRNVELFVEGDAIDNMYILLLSSRSLLIPDS